MYLKGARMKKTIFSALALVICLVASGAQAADRGPLKYAEGQYDAASGAYTVVRGDDLDAIAERFGVTVAELKEANDVRQGLFLRSQPP